MTLSIRQRPPLRLSHDIQTPSGKHYRWGEDEPRADNVPSGVHFSTTMPGGFETGECVLPRKPGISYSDLERLSTWTVYGAGGEVAWQGRLERAPRTSGEQVAVSPSAVGWQAHLEDDKSAREIYVDRDLSRWGEASRARQAAFLAAGDRGSGPSLLQGKDSGIPGLEFVWTRLAQTGAPGNAEWFEAWYDAQGLDIGSLYYDYDAQTNMGAGWVAQPYLTTDDIASAFDNGTNHVATPAAGTLTATAAGRKFALIQAVYTGGFTGDDTWSQTWNRLAVFGRHGLTKRGTAPDQGFYASDIVGHAVATWASFLNVDSDSVQPSSFIIPQTAHLEPTTAGEIVRQATRFGLEDWAVWDNKEFVWHQRGARGRRWRARISPSQLEETGQDAARLFESVVVQYQDVDGTTRTVGPTGSGADTEDAVLKDTDPENPANNLGIVKRALLQMGVATVGSATEVGRRFLEEQKLLDRSGRARLVGHVQDDCGVLHAAWKVRAGDYISFVDASDSGYRRIVKTDYSHPDRACSIDLDAPPEGLQALLERLGVVLVALGL